MYNDVGDKLVNWNQFLGKYMKYLALIVSFTVALQVLFAAQPSVAQNYGIAATVNDSAITNISVKERLELAIASSGLPDTSEVRVKLLPQVVQLLIDESLLEQEAVSKGINLSEKEVDAAMASVAQKNNITLEELPAFFMEKGISGRAVRQQVRAQIVRTKLMAREVRPQVSVTQQDIEEKMENIASQAGREEFKLAEIVLPVDSPEDEQKVAKLAEKLYEELNNSSNDFSAVAREFSRSSTADAGGEIGWIVEDSLSDDLRVQISSLKSGEVSRPLRLADGYHLMKLENRRAIISASEAESEIGMRQIFLPVTANDALEVRQQAVNRLNALQSSVRGCEAFAAAAEQLNSQADSKMVMTQLKDIKENIRNTLVRLPVGVPSPIVTSDNGLHVFMVCERIQATDSFVQPERVRAMLEQQELELYFRRFLQELRREAFVEIRL